MIDISNYEAYVIDYLDGNLDADCLGQFEAFLLKHPDIAEEIEALASEEFKIVAPKSSLDSDPIRITVTAVDGIDELNYEEFMALSLDEDLNPELATRLKSFVAKNPLLEKDYRQYQATKVEPSQLLQFPLKENLKRPVPLFSQLSIVRSIAAAIIVLLGIVSVLNILEEKIYMPRMAATEFNELSIIELRTNSPELKPSERDEVYDIAFVDNSKNGKKPESISEIARPRLVTNWVVPHIEEREMPSLAMSLPRVESKDYLADAQKSPELNLTQFVGQELLGIDAEHSRTTKSLLAESAKKVIEQSDQLALNTESNNDQRKTVSFMAGAFEFKRVTYDLQ